MLEVGRPHKDFAKDSNVTKIQGVTRSVHKTYSSAYIQKFLAKPYLAEALKALIDWFWGDISRNIWALTTLFQMKCCECDTHTQTCVLKWKLLHNFILYDFLKIGETHVELLERMSNEHAFTQDTTVSDH
jgi:hypothetical protein